MDEGDRASKKSVNALLNYQQISNNQTPNQAWNAILFRRNS